MSDNNSQFSMTDSSRATVSINLDSNTIQSETHHSEYRTDSNYKPPGNNKLLAALLISLAASQVVYSNIATFLPPYRTQKHPGLSDFSVAIILT